MSGAKPTSQYAFSCAAGSKWRLALHDALGSARQQVAEPCTIRHLHNTSIANIKLALSYLWIHIIKTDVSTAFCNQQHDWMAECHLRRRSVATLPDGLELLPFCLQIGPQLLSCHVAPLLYETLSSCFPFCLQTATTHTHIQHQPLKWTHLLQLVLKHICSPQALYAYNNMISPR